MKNSGIKPISRILLLLSAIALVAVLFTPMWRIDLNAPQYPEGLRLLIFSNKLGGNVDIINGLNHYIGMKTLHTEDFIEFKLLPYLIGFFVVAFTLTAILGSRRLLNLSFFLFVCFGVVAMIDFWRWEYNYGHNLNPDAAIIVPGMAYQPPLIGFKQLLNFGAYSVPDIGGWIFVAVGAIALLLVFMEWRRHKLSKRTNVSPLIILLATGSWLSSCNAGPEALQPGRDNCSFCKMTISDTRFGAELITRKGKIFKFDDPQCMLSFIKAGGADKNEVRHYYFTNFSGPHQLLDADKAVIIQTDALRGPMNGNIIAFANADSLQKITAEYNGKKINWPDLLP